MKARLLNISLEKAKPEKLFYFVVTGVIYNPKLKKCLILKRSEKETVHPGLWGVVGGKLEWNDLRSTVMTRKNFVVYDWEGMVEKLLAREAMEESGLPVKNPKYLDSVVFIRPDGVPAVCVKFGVKTNKSKVTIPADFDDFAWVNNQEIKKYKCIQGIAKEVKNTIKLFSQLS